MKIWSFFNKYFVLKFIYIFLIIIKIRVGYQTWGKHINMSDISWSQIPKTT
jgi:hypothetical protein